MTEVAQEISHASTDAAPDADAGAASAKTRKPRKQTVSNLQRSLDYMREQGYTCAIVERWNPFARVRQDLYGFIDILAIKGEDIVGVQACSRGDIQPHVDKIVEHKKWPLVCKAIRVVVHGWDKTAAGQVRLKEVAL